MADTSNDAIAALVRAQEAVDAAVAAGQPATQQPWSSALVQFLVSVELTFAVIAIVLATALLWRSKASAEHVLKIFGLIVILALSAVLLTVGYSSDQLTPIIGLFGAIAGYLLGKEAAKVDVQPQPQPQPPPVV